jgi:hypothetical protein
LEAAPRAQVTQQPPVIWPNAARTLVITVPPLAYRLVMVAHKVIYVIHELGIFFPGTPSSVISDYD